MNWRNNHGLVICQSNYDQLPPIRKKDYVATYEEANFVDNYVYSYTDEPATDEEETEE